MVYRAEIDGLRAISVIAIVLLHAGFGLFSGGFIGVDIFFVISGYLITTILIEDIVNKKNNILYFYQRRARRILPALFFVLVITYIISWFIFLPGPHKVVGQYTVTSIFSVSNFLLFLQGNNYFGLEQGQNPLFHTWSLGVEEQFYLLFPAFLILIWGLGRRKSFFIIVILTAISFGVSELTLDNNLNANFYLLHSRIWELFAGSIVAFVLWNRNIKSSNVFSVLGMAAIIFSFFFYDQFTPFPSVFTLVPIIGVMLIILYGNKGTVVAKLLGNKIFVNIGIASYSIYLWHVPLKIFSSYMISDQIIQLIFYFFFLSMLSWFSYRFVEMPFRKSISFKVLLIISLIVGSLLTYLGILGHKNNGFPSRSVIFSNLQQNNGMSLNCNGNTIINETCSDGDSPNLAVLGNSYAMAYVNGLRKDENFKVVQITLDSCAIGFVDEVKGVNNISCKDFYEQAVKTINNNNSIAKVIISSPFSKEMDDNIFKTSFKNLLQLLSHKDVYVIGPTPSSPFSVGECVFKSYFFYKRNCDFIVSKEHFDRINSLKKFFKNSHVVFIDITNVICPSGICKMNIGFNNAMYSDNKHLSISGSELILNEIISNFKN